MFQIADDDEFWDDLPGEVVSKEISSSTNRNVPFTITTSTSAKSLEDSSKASVIAFKEVENLDELDKSNLLITNKTTIGKIQNEVQVSPKRDNFETSDNTTVDILADNSKVISDKISLTNIPSKNRNIISDTDFTIEFDDDFDDITDNSFDDQHVQKNGDKSVGGYRRQNVHSNFITDTDKTKSTTISRNSFNSSETYPEASNSSTERHNTISSKTPYTPNDSFQSTFNRICHKNDAGIHNIQQRSTTTDRNTSPTSTISNPISMDIISTPVINMTPKIKSLKNQSEETRKFPGPAGILPPLGTPSTPDLNDDPVDLDHHSPTSDDITKPVHQPTNNANLFSGGEWKQLVTDLGPEADTLLQDFSIAKFLYKMNTKQLPLGKVPLLFVGVETLEMQGEDAYALLSDQTGNVKACIHRDVICDNEVSVGSILVLRQTGVISPTSRTHYLNVTSSNIIMIYSPSNAKSHELHISKLNDEVRTIIDNWQIHQDSMTLITTENDFMENPQNIGNMPTVGRVPGHFMESPQIGRVPSHSSMQNLDNFPPRSMESPIPVRSEFPRILHERGKVNAWVYKNKNDNAIPQIQDSFNGPKYRPTFGKNTMNTPVFKTPNPLSTQNTQTYNRNNPSTNSVGVNQQAQNLSRRLQPISSNIIRRDDIPNHGQISYMDSCIRGTATRQANESYSNKRQLANENMNDYNREIMLSEFNNHNSKIRRFDSPTDQSPCRPENRDYFSLNISPTSSVCDQPNINNYESSNSSPLSPINNTSLNTQQSLFNTPTNSKWKFKSGKSPLTSPENSTNSPNICSRLRNISPLEKSIVSPNLYNQQRKITSPENSVDSPNVYNQQRKNLPDICIETIETRKNPHSNDPDFDLDLNISPPEFHFTPVIKEMPRDRLSAVKTTQKQKWTISPGQRMDELYDDLWQDG